MKRDLIVLKFGSSVLREPDDVRSAVHEIYRHARLGLKVIAVVSAMGDETDHLLAQAKKIAPDSSGHLLAYYLASAEQKSAALLAMYIERVGLPVKLLDPRDAEFTIKGSHRDGEPAGIDKMTLEQALEDADVLVFPGFFGIGEDGTLSLLGRGGSDLTAIFLASELGARECRLIKDVDGLYEWDPAKEGPRPRRYSAASWEDAIKVAGQLVQPKAIDYAKGHGYPVVVSAAGSNHTTIIGEGPSALADTVSEKRIRVVLLGLGTVGYGVYQHLKRDSARFEIAGIVVRDPAKYAALDVDPGLLMTDPALALGAAPDMLVETIGGLDPAYGLVRQALEKSIPVVTANKDMIATHWEILKAISINNNVSLCYSSAIGGGIFAVESIDGAVAQGNIQRFDGILNGTCNFILDHMEQGMDFTDALALAQEKGFAETDPSRDIEGLDAAAKLSILARHAFGSDIAPENFHIEGLKNSDKSQMTDVRHVASCWREGGKVYGSVALKSIGANDGLDGVNKAANRLVITMEDGSKIVTSGEGAGRWPTSESLFADIMDVYRSFQRLDQASPEQVLSAS